MYFQYYFLYFVIFPRILAYLPIRAGVLTAMEFKVPRPAPPGSDELGERRRAHRHTTARHDKKP
jgi:hypothetical protein